MFILYIVNRLRLKMYFEIKWSKLKIKQYYISSKRLDGHMDLPKTFFGIPGREVQNWGQFRFSGTYGSPSIRGH
jgi:hypothetical protein